MLGAVALLVSVALDLAAYPRYNDDGVAPFNDPEACKSCHGDYNSGSYVSNADGQAWGTNLMDGHQLFIPNGCNVCHKSGPKGDVALNLSSGEGGLAPIGCLGCHGRDDGTGTVTGAGLRQHHWRNGTTVCGNAGCHPGDSNPASYTPVGEDVLPPYYANPGTFSATMPDHPCNLQGFGYSEDIAGTALGGLDNDGDNVYDTLDLDCGAVVDVESSTWGRIKALFKAE
jgi:hypothetical protein